MRHRTPEDLPTVHSAIETDCKVSGMCADCGHCAPLDLPALARDGFGDTALIRLPLRCVCGSKRSSIIVSGKGGYDGVRSPG